METTKKSGYAPVNGLNMYYEVHGEGDLPLVLIHGGGSTIGTSFGNILPLFAEQGKVIAVELQAHGRTSDRDAPESFVQDADDVAALLRYLGIDKADILGFSNGGSTALQMAIRHPGLVNRIVVISGAYKRDGFIDALFDGLGHATLDNMPAPLKTAYLELTSNQQGLQTMFEKDRDRMIGFKDWPDDELKGIRAPALLIVGDQDVITVEHTLQMSKLIPQSRLAVIPGNHGSFIAEVCAVKPGSKVPELTVALIEEFLKE